MTFDHRHHKRISGWTVENRWGWGRRLSDVIPQRQKGEGTVYRKYCTGIICCTFCRKITSGLIRGRVWLLVVPGGLPVTQHSLDKQAGYCRHVMPNYLGYAPEKVKKILLLSLSPPLPPRLCTRKGVLVQITPQYDRKGLCTGSVELRHPRNPRCVARVSEICYRHRNRTMGLELLDR